MCRRHNCSLLLLAHAQFAGRPCAAPAARMIEIGEVLGIQGVFHCGRAHGSGR
jgi:hypothetical protein